MLGFNSCERRFGEPDGEGEEVADDGGEKRCMLVHCHWFELVMVPRRESWDRRWRTFVSFYIQSGDCARGRVFHI